MDILPARYVDVFQKIDLIFTNRRYPSFPPTPQPKRKLSQLTVQKWKWNLLQSSRNSTREPTNVTCILVKLIRASRWGWNQQRSKHQTFKGFTLSGFGIRSFDGYDVIETATLSTNGVNLTIKCCFSCVHANFSSICHDRAEWYYPDLRKKFERLVERNLHSYTPNSVTQIKLNKV